MKISFCWRIKEPLYPSNSFSKRNEYPTVLLWPYSRWQVLSNLLNNMADLASLRMPRPSAPPLSGGSKKVQCILRDVEKIRFYTKKRSKQVKIAENLVYYIVQSLDNSNTDHLLHTTTIWSLMTIYKLFPKELKPVMLAAGVPRVLYDVIKADLLTGSTRQYASELCFFLRYADFKAHISFI